MSVSGAKDKKSDPPKSSPESKKPDTKAKPKPEPKKPDPPKAPAHAKDQFEKKNGVTPKSAPQLDPPSAPDRPLELSVSQGQVQQPKPQPPQMVATGGLGDTVVAGPQGQAVVKEAPAPQVPISPSQLAEQLGLPDPALPPPVGPVKPEGPPVCVAEPPSAAAAPPAGPTIGPASPEAIQQLEAQKLASAGQVPPIPSSTGTVTVSGNTMTDEQKIAAGALEIKPPPPAPNGVDPKTYDGMYIGSDGFAYPPDRFEPSQVPPFAPRNPISNPPPTTYFVNGILTPQTEMATASQELANRSGTNVVPIYNATDYNATDAVPAIGGLADVAQTGLDRAGLGDNPAAQTLARAINQDLAAGLNVNVVGYSQGGAIVSSALRDVDPARMGQINVVGIASAGETWPAGPKYTFYVNQYDVVPNVLGVHRNAIWDGVTAGLGLLNPVLPVLSGLGSTAPGATVYLIDDPENVQADPFSPHYIGTYFQHIPER